MKSELRLVGLVRTMSLRRAQSRTPSIATLALWPGAGTRRSAPLFAQTCARSRRSRRLGLVREQKHEVARLGLGLEQLPAQARPVHRVPVLATFQGVAGPSPAGIPLLVRNTRQR